MRGHYERGKSDEIGKPLFDTTEREPRSFFHFITEPFIYYKNSILWWIYNRL